MVGGVPATRGHLAGGRPRPPAAPQRVALRHAGRPASADDHGPRRPCRWRANRAHHRPWRANRAMADEADGALPRHRPTQRDTTARMPHQKNDSCADIRKHRRACPTVRGGSNTFRSRWFPRPPPAACAIPAASPSCASAYLPQRHSLLGITSRRACPTAPSLYGKTLHN